MTADERRAWLRERMTGLGGTDLAAVAGVGFRDAAGVYAEKVADAPADRPPSPLMRMGTLTEPLNAELYRERTGADLIERGLMRSPSHPWALATLDRLALDTTPAAADGRSVELKYVRFFGDEWGQDGSDRVPDGYLVQATWQALVLRHNGHRVSRTDVSALSGDGEHRVFVIPFDDRLAGLLLALGAEFWARVESRSGVEGWRSPLCDEVTNRLAEIKPDTSIDLAGEQLDLAYEIVRLSAIKADGEAAGKAARKLKLRLAESMGEAQFGNLPDGRRVKRQVIRRAGYAVEPTSYTDVRVVEPKKKGAPQE